ncbi:FkbM family methyltransferase [Pendulispora rubella]|uniref:FkbM family methyltransferase n=1 Tax=Pendulispora rubella TaxID=2741070 RepID=A0ABZ2LJ97_9BACT
MSTRSIAFMFPGLGDHHVGMGLELYRTLPVFREQIDRCAAFLEPELGVDIRTLMHPQSAPPPLPASAGKKLDLRRMLGRDGRAPTPEESRLNETRNAHPALFVLEYALAKQWQAWGAEPEAMIGYSLGEYVAACLAGVLSLEDSLTLVARRALLVESLPAGAMLAVMLSEAQLEPLLGGHVSLSAVNGPEFCVASGSPEAVQELQTRLRDRGAAFRRVQSSHAFHSNMMEPIAGRVTDLVRGFARHAPKIPYVSNVTGTWITAAQATDPAYWAAHLCRPVRFAEGLGALTSQALLEVGPGQTLSSLVSPAPARIVVPSMRHALDPESDTSVLQKATARLDGLEKESTAKRPFTKTEQELAAIWQAVLKCEAPALDAHFFQLGGNSLQATRLLDRLSKTFRVRLPLRRIYEVPTLELMAAALDAPRSGSFPTRSSASPKSVNGSLFRLPNGLSIAHQNEAETRHFYDDIFAHRSYVKHGIRIPDGGCVLDVGGNIGLFTVFAHTEAKNVRIFTFEPAPPLFEIIQRNVAQHGIRATVFNVGLSNLECEAPFTFYPHSAGMSSFHPNEAEERHNLQTIIENQRRSGDAAVDQIGEHASELLDVRFAATTFDAKLRRLSDVLREQNIERVDLMKVDVQKCELEVIEGIDDADWPKFSQIVLEAHDEGGRVGKLVELFERRGFSVIAEQDALYVGTNIFNIYAIRKGS